MVSTVVRTADVDVKSVTSEMMLLWLLTLLLDFAVLQPLVVVLGWSGWTFDVSWALSQQVNLEWAQYLYSLS